MKIGEREVELSNEDKPLFPAAGISKGELVAYYRDIANAMVPHIKDRALTLQRYPDGIDSSGFVQQNASDYFPDWIPRERLGKGTDTDHPIVREPASLAYLANKGTIEFHAWLSRIDRPSYPDRMVFDLDPPGDDFAVVRFAARMLFELLTGELGLNCFVMTTGSSGLHVVVPLDRDSDFDSMREFAHTVANRVAGRAPQRLTTEQRINQRRGRLFLDTTRNAYGQTAISPYSVRAKPGAPVAAPLAWEEVDDSHLAPDRYHLKNIFRRLSQLRCEPWLNIARHACKLETRRERLENLK